MAGMYGVATGKVALSRSQASAIRLGRRDWGVGLRIEEREELNEGFLLIMVDQGVGLGELIDEQLEVALDEVDALRGGDDGDAAAVGVGAADAADEAAGFQAINEPGVPRCAITVGSPEAVW